MRQMKEAVHGAGSETGKQQSMDEETKGFQEVTNSRNASRFSDFVLVESDVDLSMASPEPSIAKQSTITAGIGMQRGAKGSRGAGALADFGAMTRSAFST